MGVILSLEIQLLLLRLKMALMKMCIRDRNKNRKQDCYICGSYKKRTRDCTAHFIRTDLLTAGVPVSYTHLIKPSTNSNYIF